MVEFRYRKLGYVALNVSDLDRSVDFYRKTVGLDLTDRNDGIAFLRCSEGHHDIVLYQASKPGLKRIGWELESEADYAAARETLKRLGLEPREVGDNERQSLHQGPSFRIREPHSKATFEYYTHMALTTAPYRKDIVDIEGLGHILVGAPDVARAAADAVEKLNFQISDMYGTAAAFMRCFPNPMHHSFGFAHKPEGGFHHLTFMVGHVDDIGRSHNRLRRAGVPIVYGPGRHPPSGSFFVYFLDPDGLTIEYSHGMELFPEEGARKPRLFEQVPSSLDYWEGEPEPAFAAAGVIDTD